MASKIIKLKATDEVPTGAKFLHSKEEFIRMVGFISNLRPYYETIFYYEVKIK